MSINKYNKLKYKNKRDELIGSTYHTQVGGVITIVGHEVNKIKNKSTAKYLVNCSLCSPNNEIFTTSIRALNNRSFPCDCPKNYRERLYKEDRDSFLGTQFPTPAGGILTVNSYHLDKSKPKVVVVYHVSCSICSLDTELFPEDFHVLKGNLVSGQCCCACSSSVVWTKEQYMIKINRELDRRGNTTLKGVDWIEKLASSKLHLFCHLHNHEWSSTCISHFLNGRGCKICAINIMKTYNTKDDSIMESKFLSSGKYTEGTKFTRNLERSDSMGRFIFWDMHCPKCSGDEYVKEGLCSGVFTSTISAFSSGAVLCRCNPRYVNTFEQNVYMVKKILEEESCKFLSLVKNETKNYLLVKWICKNGHAAETRLSSFLHTNTRCKYCALNENENVNGFYYDRVEEKDYLYVIFFDNFVKVGRSFRPSVRFNKIYPYTDGELISVQLLLTSSHKNIYKLEQDCLKHIKGLGFGRVVPWSGEVFDIHAKPFILDYIYHRMGNEVGVFFLENVKINLTGKIKFIET